MGLFDSILGPGFLGLSGSSSTTEQKVDPTTQALNNLRYGQLAEATGQTGGLSGLLNLNWQGAGLTPQTQYNLANASGYALAPGLESSNWYHQALQGLNYQPQSDYLSQLYGQAGQAGGAYYRDIIGPQIGNQYALMGLGRSGGREQAEALAASNIGLPIAMQHAQAQGGLQTQYLQNLYGLNQQYPNVDINTRNAQLGRFGQGIGFSDYARQAQQVAAQQQMQGYLSAMNATPFTPSGTQIGEKNEGLLNTAFGAGVGQGVGMAATKSDRTDKEAIEEFDSRDFLDNLNAYIFEYKDKSTDLPGKHIGIMAQELEEIPLAKAFVIEHNGSKYIDYKSMSGLLMACIVDLNTRMRRLENGSV